jgi:hypothetical protein
MANDGINNRNICSSGATLRTLGLVLNVFVELVSIRHMFVPKAKAGAGERGPSNAEAGNIFIGNSFRTQVFRGRLTGSTISNNVEGYPLPLVKGAHSCSLYSTDMNEDVLVAFVRLYKTKALLIVKPLYDAGSHQTLSLGCIDPIAPYA